MTKQEIKTIEKCSQKLELLFGEFNRTVCSDCPEAQEGSKVGKHCPVMTKEAGCCSQCAESLGYFQFTPNPKSKSVFSSTRLSDYWKKEPNLRYPWIDRAIKHFKAHFLILKDKYWFDNKYGFFNPKIHSCQLPRNERSVICSRHCCNYEMMEIARPIAQKMENIKISNGLLY